MKNDQSYDVLGFQHRVMVFAFGRERDVMGVLESGCFHGSVHCYSNHIKDHAGYTYAEIPRSLNVSSALPKLTCLPSKATNPQLKCIPPQSEGINCQQWKKIKSLKSPKIKISEGRLLRSCLNAQPTTEFGPWQNKSRGRMCFNLGTVTRAVFCS